MAVVRLFIENIDDVSRVTEELENLGMKILQGDLENMSLLSVNFENPLRDIKSSQLFEFMDFGISVLIIIFLGHLVSHYNSDHVIRKL